MANTSRGFTPRQTAETPSNRKFVFKKPGSTSRPFASEISGDTPFLSTDDVAGHASTENPYNKSIFASGSFDSAVGETENIVRATTSSGHVTSRSKESEAVATNSNRVMSKTPQYGNKTVQRPMGLGPYGFPNFDKETPYLIATAKQNDGAKSGASSRDSYHTGNVSSAYFSKSATSTLPHSRNKGKRQPQRTPMSSSLTTGNVSASFEADSSVAMGTEIEGEMSGEDLGQVRTVERPESSMSVDSQVFYF